MAVNGTYGVSVPGAGTVPNGSLVNLPTAGNVSMVGESGTLVAGASSTGTFGVSGFTSPFGAGAPMLAGNVNNNGTTAALTGNTNVNIGNALILAGGTTSIAGGTITGTVTLGDASNHALNLSGPVTLAGIAGTGGLTASNAGIVPIQLTIVTPGNGVTISGDIGECNYTSAGGSGYLAGTYSSVGSGITKAGPGTLTLTGNLNYTGRTIIKAGTLKAVGVGAKGLLAGLASGSGALDVQGGQAVFDYTSLGLDPATLDSTIVNPLMQTAYANGWAIDATHPVGSTTADATHGLGWTDTVVGGENLLTVMYTLYGDCNLDGTVNGGGPEHRAVELPADRHPWAQGDFNYDGTINGADLNIVLSNFQQHVSVTGAVPEPSSLLLIAAGLAGLLAYAWRKRK